MPHVVPTRQLVNASVTGVCTSNQKENTQYFQKYVKSNDYINYVQASSFEDGFSPWLAFSGNSANTWISNTTHGLGQWIQMDFSKKMWVGSIDLVKSTKASSNAITSVKLTAGKLNLGTRAVSWSSSGVARINVGAYLSTLRISISGIRQSRSKLNVGFGINSPDFTSGVAYKPRFPTLLLDGHPLNATMKKEKSVGPLGGLFPNYALLAQVKLVPGTHVFTMPLSGNLYGCDVSLTSGSVTSTMIHPVATRQTSATSYIVPASSVGNYLILESNSDSAWSASLNGERFNAYLPINSFAESWHTASSSKSGQIHVNFQDGVSTGRLILYWLSGLLIIGVAERVTTILVSRGRRGSDRPKPRSDA